MTFEKWYENATGITVVEAANRGLWDLDLMRQCWNASREACQEVEKPRQLD
jgi:hypothetical protein